MSIRTITIGLAVLACAAPLAPLAAQQRGTMEFGAFASAASFDNSLSLKTGFGGGGRIGMYLDDIFSIEFEDAEMRVSRPNGLQDVNAGLLSGRLVATPFSSGALSFLIGAGAGVSTETNFLHSYGVDALAGVKYAVSPNAAIRLDGVVDFLANYNYKHFQSVRLGLSLYRRPSQVTNTVTVMSAPVMTMREDSVSAAETRRLRAQDAALRALRDSLARTPAPSGRASSGERIPIRKDVPNPSMETQLRFVPGNAGITDSTAMLLDSRVGMFRDSPDMTIIVLGNWGRAGSALGTRRAQVVKEYLVEHGVPANRIVVEPTLVGMSGDAATRKSSYRLLIVPDPM